MNALILDYKTTDAIAMFTRESADSSSYTAALMVNDLDEDRRLGHAVQRLILGTDNGDAGLTINSPDGKPRLIIQVDRNNQMVFNILDEEGNIIKSFIN